MSRLSSWLVVALLTSGMTAVTTAKSLRHYHAFESGWSWDLAYYNQWYWALTQDDGLLSVRPVSSYAQEGPSVWKMNYLAPVRILLIPAYWLVPDPRTLLVIQNIVFWWVIPAAYTFVRSQCASERIALSAATLVPFTPLLWPLVLNDFRELQLAIPFVLWTVQGVRERSSGLTAAGIVGMLACRQEFALMVASFAFLSAKQSEPLSKKLNWRQALLAIGLLWFLFGFFGYLKLTAGSRTPDHFIDQFLGPRASVGETLATALELLAVGLGAWAALALLGPDVGILAIPWIWSLCNGRWALRYLSTEEWHHVRYTVPAVALTLAAGLLGYARAASWLQSKRGSIALTLLWIFAAACCGPGLVEVHSRLNRIPHAVSPEEATALWYWIHQVDGDEGVVAAYEISAPLSSRRELYSYRLDANKPRGFPQLRPEINWLFIRRGELDPAPFLDQGFQPVHSGSSFVVLRRVRDST